MIYDISLLFASSLFFVSRLTMSLGSAAYDRHSYYFSSLEYERKSQQIDTYLGHLASTSSAGELLISTIPPILGESVDAGEDALGSAQGSCLFYYVTRMASAIAHGIPILSFILPSIDGRSLSQNRCNETHLDHPLISSPSHV